MNQNQLININLNNLNLYDKKDLYFLSTKAFSYYEHNLIDNYEEQRIPHCGGLLLYYECITFYDTDIFNKWRIKNNDWDYTKSFFEKLLTTQEIDIEKLLTELSTCITEGNKKKIQDTYDKYLLNIPVTLEDISPYGNIFLITLISVPNKSLEHVLKLLNKYCVENHKTRIN